MSDTPRRIGFHHIAVRALDFDKSLRFYTEGLGCARTYGWGEGDGRIAFLDLGDGTYIELFGRSVEPRGVEPTDVLMHFAVYAPNIEEAYERALAAGGTSYIKPKDVNLKGDYPLSFRNCLVQGPSGEIIEFLDLAKP